jgi:hypothetical protein
MPMGADGVASHSHFQTNPLIVKWEREYSVRNETGDNYNESLFERLMHRESRFQKIFKCSLLKSRHRVTDFDFSLPKQECGNLWINHDDDRNDIDFSHNKLFGARKADCIKIGEIGNNHEWTELDPSQNNETMKSLEAITLTDWEISSRQRWIQSPFRSISLSIAKRNCHELMPCNHLSHSMSSIDTGAAHCIHFTTRHNIERLVRMPIVSLWLGHFEWRAVPGHHILEFLPQRWRFLFHVFYGGNIADQFWTRHSAA